MPALQAPLLPEGAIVAVEVGLSRQETGVLRRASRPIPQPLTLRALLDTGADGSCIDPAAWQTFPVPALAGASMANVPALGGMRVTLQRYASVRVVHPSGDRRKDLVLANLLLMEVSLSVLGYEVLLGRDALKKCRFLYDGPGGRFRLKW